MMNLINNVKNKAIKIKDSAVNFCQEHKSEVIGGVALAVTTSFCIYLGIKNHEKDQLIKGKDDTIDNLAKEVKQLTGQMKIKDSIIHSNNERIDFLKDLCERKDEVMCAVMSDGLRYGSPLCGQQMGYKAHQKV